MKASERARGTELAGQVVSVAPGVFLLGLSGLKNDVQRNVELLKGQPWLDISIVYKSGRRSLIAIEKGLLGERVISEAFVRWGS
jgi:hypothetical protein